MEKQSDPPIVPLTGTPNEDVPQDAHDALSAPVDAQGLESQDDARDPPSPENVAAGEKKH